MIVRRRALPALTVEDQLPTVFGEGFGNRRYREHEVHSPRHDRTPRHAVKLGVVRILRDDEPALFLDRLQSQAAIAAGSREDHADRAAAELLRQRAQEEVERQPCAVTLPRLREVEGAGLDREIGTRWNKIDMLGLERHPVCCLLHFHRRMAGQQIDHHARMRRIEMLDQNEGHAGAGRERGEQPPGGIEAAGRGAKPDDREAVMPGWRATPWRRTPARRRASRSGPSLTLSSCHPTLPPLSLPTNARFKCYHENFVTTTLAGPALSIP